MQHDLIEAGVGASRASLPKLAASTDEIAGAKNRPHGLSPRPDAAALLRRILGANERPWRDPLEWYEFLARPHQYRKSDRAVLTFLAIFQNRQAYLACSLQATGAEAFRALRATISCANHPCCTALFCSSLRGWHCFAFPCLALPRRHCSPARPTLDCRSQCLDDHLLGRFLSVVHLTDLLLDRVSLSIRADRYGVWSDSRLARFDDDSLGKPTGRTFLHSERLARASCYARNRSTFCLRLVARHAFRQQRSGRSALADHGLRNAAFPGSCCRVNKLLSRLFYWGAPANHPS